VETIMPELYLDAPGKSDGFAGRAFRAGRALAALALMVIGLVVTIAAASVIAIAAIAIALIFAAGVGVMWLLARLSRPRRSAAPDVQTLEARKGPRGWTVETRRYSF
jgi:hypothetical protein